MTKTLRVIVAIADEEGTLLERFVVTNEGRQRRLETIERFADDIRDHVEMKFECKEKGR